MDEWTLYFVLIAIGALIVGVVVSKIIYNAQKSVLVERNTQLQNQLGEKDKLIDQNMENLNTAGLQMSNLKTEQGQLKTELVRNETLAGQVQNQLELYKTELNQERTLLQQASVDKDKLSSSLAVAENDVKTLTRKLIEYKDDVDNMEKRFENLANKIFQEKTTILKEESKTNIQNLLNPLKDKIHHFEKRVNQVHSEAQEQQGQLKEQLLQLQDLNQQVSQEANNLTKALKGDKKIQGNWGEMVLDTILQKSGLEEGREYQKQVHLVDEASGKRYQPDVVIHMPDQKKMIIDSKVSLIAYEQIINAETQDEENEAIKAHVFAIRNHIKSLSEKSYHDLIQASPDFVLMFIPIETAFNIVTQEFPKLYNEAFEKNIVIVTPSTLLVSLKTIESLWQNDKQQKYSLDIANEAGKMYDKFQNLLDDLNKLGKQLDTTTRTYKDSMNKLTDGTGNLIRRAEKIKQLGAKANKQIDSKWLDRAEDESSPDN